MSSASAAIYYYPEAYSNAGPKLMGRNAAGASFLRGYLAHAKTQAFYAQVEKLDHAESLATAIRAAGRSEPLKVVTAEALPALGQAGTLYCPDPDIGEHAWRRAMYGHATWSLCGITHTTASAGAMDSIVALLTAPVQPWDALICTSSAVKDNVERVLQAQVDYLKERLDIGRVVLPQMPVIPLGIHAADFAFDAEQRGRARQKIGAGEETRVVLYLGRLSPHAKAHPLAMYQALQKASATLPAEHDVMLVECGWHDNKFLAQAYRDAAQCTCPAVQVVTLDGRVAEERETAWASADVFCSLPDSIQETFGIVPIEAMAAGLPLVVSDWDGYRETVRDGVEGFRIPTLMPQAGLGGDLAVRHATHVDNYDMYCGHTGALVAVDIDATAQAFARLFASPELRRRMGESGRKRAATEYDWSVIIPRYEALWEHLADRRAADAHKLKLLPHPWPARMDAFAAFARYPSIALTPDTVLKRARPDASQALARLRDLAIVRFASHVLPTEAECEQVLAQLAEGPRAAGVLVQRFPVERQAFVLRSLAWMAKMGVLSRAD